LEKIFPKKQNIFPKWQNIFPKKRKYWNTEILKGKFFHFGKYSLNVGFAKITKIFFWV
jgi:hypothetical protein